MKYLILFVLVFITGCNYAMVPQERIDNLNELNTELRELQNTLKDRQKAYSEQGNKTGQVQTSAQRNVLNQILGVTEPVVSDSKPIAKIITDQINKINKIIPTPYTAYLDLALQLVGGIAVLGGGAYGCKKGHKVITRKNRIQQAELQVKASPVGGLGKMQPCNPQIQEAMRLYLDKQDYLIWCKKNNCI